MFYIKRSSSFQKDLVPKPTSLAILSFFIFIFIFIAFPKITFSASSARGVIVENEKVQAEIKHHEVTCPY